MQARLKLCGRKILLWLSLPLLLFGCAKSSDNATSGFKTDHFSPETDRFLKVLVDEPPQEERSAGRPAPPQDGRYAKVSASKSLESQNQGETVHSPTSSNEEELERELSAMWALPDRDSNIRLAIEEGKMGKKDKAIKESPPLNSPVADVDLKDRDHIGALKLGGKERKEKGGSKHVRGMRKLADQLSAAMTGTEDGSLVIGHGHGGIALNGTGSGGGGVGFGRIHGMGRIDTGGGRGSKNQLRKKGKRRRRVHVRSGTPNISSSCEEKDVVRVLNARQRGISYCYEKELAKDPELVGEVTLSWRITTGGKVQKVAVISSTLESKKVEACIKRSIQRWRFPRSEGGVCQVRLPFLFGESDQMGQKNTQASPAEERLRYLKPSSFLPRIFYFENTYLGGNAAYAERLRRLDRDFKRQGLEKPYRLAQLQAQEFDFPREAGLALYAQLDRPYLDRPSRVILQVGLQGSHRYRWRRPPLDLMLLVDHPISANLELLMSAVSPLLKQLGPQDRLGIILAGERPRVLSPLSPTRALRRRLARLLQDFKLLSNHGPTALRYALEEAGRQFNQAADAQVPIPGSQILLMLVQGGKEMRVRVAEAAVHRLSLQGVVSSVIDLDPGQGSPWWSVAHAGNGNLHSLEPDHDIEDLIEEELGSLSKVIARLLRLNIRLAPGVKAIQVIGSRKLKAREVKEVKAREVATDRNLSKSLGLKADRGEDGDGVQTVIPYFYGGDSHVVLLELWVERAGSIADVSLDFKDMVRLRNAQARTSVSLGQLPRQETPTQQAVRENRRGFRFAETLERASLYAAREERSELKHLLIEAESLGGGPADLQLVQGFLSLLDAGLLERERRLLVEALKISSRLRIGSSASL